MDHRLLLLSRWRVRNSNILYILVPLVYIIASGHVKIAPLHLVRTDLTLNRVRSRGRLRSELTLVATHLVAMVVAR